VNFELNEEQIRIRDMVREFARDEIAPHAAKSRMCGVWSPMSDSARPTTLMTTVRFIRWSSRFSLSADTLKRELQPQIM